MNNSLSTTATILFAVLFTVGCSEDSDVATKDDKALKATVAAATSDCHQIAEAGDKQVCLQTVKDSPEYVELIRRADGKSSPFDTPLSDTRGNALDW